MTEDRIEFGKDEVLDSGPRNAPKRKGVHFSAKDGGWIKNHGVLTDRERDEIIQAYKWGQENGTIGIKDIAEYYEIPVASVRKIIRGAGISIHEKRAHKMKISQEDFGDTITPPGYPQPLPCPTSKRRYEDIPEEPVTLTLGDKSVALTPDELMLVKMLHPLFEGLTFQEAAKSLGVCEMTVRNRWKKLAQKCPCLEESRKKWGNTQNICARDIERAKPFSAFGSVESDEFIRGEDKFGDDMSLGFDRFGKETKIIRKW